MRDISSLCVTLQQFEQVLSDLSLDYVDALLVHWPAIHPGGAAVGQSSDAYCNTSARAYDATQCRLSTWRAMLAIFDSGRARSVCVSNYNETHLQEIIDAGLPLPSINQCPFNPYRGASQMKTLEFCRRHGITFMAYSPVPSPTVFL
jgi:diketogulonate reductase-like aldo/keto reductase